MKDRSTERGSDFKTLLNPSNIKRTNTGQTKGKDRRAEAAERKLSDTKYGSQISKIHQYSDGKVFMKNVEELDEIILDEHFHITHIEIREEQRSR